MFVDVVCGIDGGAVFRDGEGVEIAADAVAGADACVFFVVLVQLKESLAGHRQYKRGSGSYQVVFALAVSSYGIVSAPEHQVIFALVLDNLEIVDLPIPLGGRPN